jgi:ABC-2 type transport system ATP-binding protein
MIPDRALTSGAVIRTERLTKRFPGVEAVTDLTLEVPAGAVFALIGPNGAGKTTAIKALMNIFRPTAGKATVLGCDSSALGPRQLAQIGYVSENQQLPEWMPVGYFLAYSKPFYPAWDDRELAALIRQYALPLDRPIRALSRGMRVKAALAASLAYRPRLLVLDEPFSGLDALVREQLIESILERTAESTVLLASHDLAEIESFASHVAYLDRGRLEFVEETGALAARFREIEVTLENPVDLPADWPAHWMNPEHSAVVVRFTDAQFQQQTCENQVRRLLPGVRAITARPMPLRSIFIALAKSAKKSESPR